MKNHNWFGNPTTTSSLALGLYCLFIASVMLTLFGGTQIARAALVNHKLSGTMEAFSDLMDFKISPDGHYVVYRADAQTDEALELYSAPVDGSRPPVRLSGLLTAGAKVTFFALTPDGKQVIYTAPQDTPSTDELYAVPIDGGASLKLNPPLDPGEYVSMAYVSPDSQRVIHYSNWENGEFQLYSVPIGGGESVRLNGNLTPGGQVFVPCQISPDSMYLVYIASQDSSDKRELYSVPIAGGTTTKLNGVLVSGGNISSFTISPDSSRVVYWADEQVDDQIELYSVPVGGGAVTKLNKPLVADGDVLMHNIALISPDSQKVLYLADQDTDEVEEVYLTSMIGGAALKLNTAPLVSGGDVVGYAFSPDSQFVFYYGDTLTDEMNELFYVSVAGGAVTRINPPLVAGGDVSDYRISPDGQYVIYRADQEVDGHMGLYSLSIRDWNITTLSKIPGPLPSFSETVEMGYRISADGQDVVYAASAVVSGTNLFRIPIHDIGSHRTVLNSSKVAGGNIAQFTISVDNMHVIYGGDLETDEKFELYVAFDEYNLYLPLAIR